MALYDEEGAFGVDPGCPFHSEEAIAECGMCGAEFCKACYSNTPICLECAEQVLVDDEGPRPELDDARNVDLLLANHDAEESRTKRDV